MNSETIGDTAEAIDDQTGVASVPAETFSFPRPRIDDDLPQPVVRAREDHNISRRDIDPDALRALYRLSRNNYIAYLVGGSVRDLLLGRKPKDFDISTNARPEQIRSLFRNCILIGRRFRLAHIRYGDKIIETSTFRRTPECPADPADPQADLFQRDDNLFGSPREDAQRRDFTVNGLFYDIGTFSIIDYVGGLEDLALRRIRSIGDPCIRFREDPVRMVRAIRFASRLDFDFDPDTYEAIRRHGGELAKASPARLLEEISRLFAFSSGEKAVRLLRATDLLGVILPEVAKRLDDQRDSHELFWKRLESLDRGDTVLPDATPALIFAVLLLDPLKRHLGRDWNSGDFPRLKFDKIQTFLAPLAQRLRFPRKLVDRIIHMYLAQNRFISQGGKAGAIANFVTQDSFHESLALAEIILGAEGGCPTRLNQWRDMLLERMYSREESGAAGQERGRNGEDGGEEDAEQGEGGQGRGRLSRSARRRRNKKMRRQHERTSPATRESLPGNQGTASAAEPDAVPAGDARKETPAPHTATAAAAAVSPAPVVPAVSPAPNAESKTPAQPAAAERGEGGAGRRNADSNRRRRGRGRKRDSGSEASSAASSAAPASPPQAAEEEHFQPLTAAAFYRPEPPKEKETAKEKEAEKADPSEKKSSSRKGRGRGGKKAKSGTDSREDAPSGDSSRAAESRPLKEDKADEADTPMHWLDEI